MTATSMRASVAAVSIVDCTCDGVALDITTSSAVHAASALRAASAVTLENVTCTRARIAILSGSNVSSDSLNLTAAGAATVVTARSATVTSLTSLVAGVFGVVALTVADRSVVSSMVHAGRGHAQALTVLEANANGVAAVIQVSGMSEVTARSATGLYTAVACSVQSSAF